MVSRRDIVIGGISSGVMLHARGAWAKAAQPSTKVNFEVPAGACDCHTHIHGDVKKFPMFEGRGYTPEEALPEEMAQLHKAIRMQRVVIVTPSIYGTDNAATLWGMQARGNDARGVAVIGDKTSDSELDAMGKAGIRGIRLNLTSAGVKDPSVARKRFQDALARMTARNWHIQMFTNLAVISSIKDLVMASPLPVVFDQLRRRAGGQGCGTAGVFRPGGPGAFGQGLRKNFRRLPCLDPGARLSRCGAARQGTDRRQRRAHRMGHRLAAPAWQPARLQAHRYLAVFHDRRRAVAQSVAGVGARCGGAQKDTGGKPCALVRLLVRCCIPDGTFNSLLLRAFVSIPTPSFWRRPESSLYACPKGVN